MKMKEFYQQAEKGFIWTHIDKTKKEDLPSLDELLIPCRINSRVYTSLLAYCANWLNLNSDLLASRMGYEDRLAEENVLIEETRKGKLAQYLANKNIENRPSLEQLIQLNPVEEGFGVFRCLGEEKIIDVLKVLEVDENKLQDLKDKKIDSNDQRAMFSLSQIAAEILETPESLAAYKKRKTVGKSLFNRDNGVAPICASSIMLEHGIYQKYSIIFGGINGGERLDINTKDIKPQDVDYLCNFIKINNIEDIKIIFEKEDENDVEKHKFVNTLFENCSFSYIEMHADNLDFDFCKAIMKQDKLEKIETSGVDIKFSPDNKLDNLKNIRINTEASYIDDMYDFLLNHKPKKLRKVTYYQSGDNWDEHLNDKQVYDILTKHPNILVDYNGDEMVDELNTLYRRNETIIDILDSLEAPYNKLGRAIYTRCLNEFLGVFDKANLCDYNEFMNAKYLRDKSLFVQMKECYGDDFIPEFTKTAEILGFKDRASAEFKIADEVSKGNLFEYLQGINEDKRPSFASLVDKKSIFNFEKNIFEQIYDNNPHIFARKANQILDLYGVKVEDLKVMKANDADNHILPNLINVKTQANAMARRKQQITMHNLKTQNGGKE